MTGGGSVQREHVKMVHINANSYEIGMAKPLQPSAYMLVLWLHGNDVHGGMGTPRKHGNAY